jgi:hypothetical protein
VNRINGRTGKRRSYKLIFSDDLLYAAARVENSALFSGCSTLAIEPKVFPLPRSGILLTNSFETGSLQIPRLSIGPVAIVKTALSAARWVLDRGITLDLRCSFWWSLGPETWA